MIANGETRNIVLVESLKRRYDIKRRWTCAQFECADRQHRSSSLGSYPHDPPRRRMVRDDGLPAGGNGLKRFPQPWTMFFACRRRKGRGMRAHKNGARARRTRARARMFAHAQCQTAPARTAARRRRGAAARGFSLLARFLPGLPVSGRTIDGSFLERTRTG
jgi:hypothetical protein